MTGLPERWHEVRLGPDRIGDIVQRGDVTRFLFADDYWDRANRRVLGVWFEDHPGASPRSALRLPQWFSNLLPEGRLRDWIARERRVSAQREIELLLQIGHDLPGAVTVIEGGTAREWTEDEVAPQWDDEAPGPWKFSLAGVGMKFSMVQAGDRLVLPARDVLGRWIVKLPDTGFADIPANEAAMMSLAELAGLDVPEHRLVHRDELGPLPPGAWQASEAHAYAVRRFDRADGERIHIEDFAQVRGKYPGDTEKYQGTFETVAALCYRGTDLRALREWARRVAFNLAIGNGDAHLKNWSLIYPDGRHPTLSPVYDLVSTRSHLPDDDLGLKFTGTRNVDRVSPGGFAVVEGRLGVDGGGLEEIAAETVRAVIENAPGVADRYPVVSGTVDWVVDNARRVKRQLRF
ncbi:type II toxin-antitoxin system HipA family toxin [Tsukamurella soli]|uniref:HipA domain-containing protein n=1 Tax=Tsukamurella soli TaxID=644556 RepID=A0ABP8JK21_9ACTN